MSKELSWADLMNGDFQAPEPSKRYLKEDIFKNPETLINRFMDGLKTYLEKDVQKEVLTYEAFDGAVEVKGESKDAIFALATGLGSLGALGVRFHTSVLFNIALPHATQNLVLKYFLTFFHPSRHGMGALGAIGGVNECFLINELKTFPKFCDKHQLDTMNITGGTSGFKGLVNVSIPEFSLINEIDDPAYKEYAEESDWEEIYQVIQRSILQHPALKR
ncbi:MAG: hypothetical protein Q4E16_06490 [Neisseria sp.]|nr:hypothetical protein [Neisseria sp.]